MDYDVAVSSEDLSVVLEIVRRESDHHTIILTLIRHGESAANATGFIDTTVPGPDITHWAMHRPSPWQINSAQQV